MCIASLGGAVAGGWAVAGPSLGATLLVGLAVGEVVLLAIASLDVMRAVHWQTPHLVRGLILLALGGVVWGIVYAGFLGWLAYSLAVSPPTRAPSIPGLAFGGIAILSAGTPLFVGLGASWLLFGHREGLGALSDSLRRHSAVGR